MRGKLLLSIGLAGLFLALVLALLTLTGPPTARAAGGETFTVNSAGDDSDASPGDCQCRTSGGVCTLRAAIQEANACSGPQNDSVQRTHANFSWNRSSNHHRRRYSD
jgi:CSLREA domain-containing protein